MGDHLASTPATHGQCPKCRTETITGLAEGLTVHADAAAIPPADEQRHRAAGRHTYALLAGELVHRDDTRTGPVEHLHVEHHCPPPPFTADTLF